MRYLKKLIIKHININEKEWNKLNSKFKQVTIKKGTMLHFETLENSVFYKISLKEMDNFLNNADKKWEHLARVWLHDSYFSSTYKRVMSLMSEDVEQKYQRLLL